MTQEHDFRAEDAQKSERTYSRNHLAKQKRGMENNASSVETLT